MNTPGSVATMSGRRSPRIRPSIFQCCSVRVAMLWEAAERPRRDFEASGLPLKICSSFAPRVTGGKGLWRPITWSTGGSATRKQWIISAKLSGRSFSTSASAARPAHDWARRNGMIPLAGLQILRLALAEIAHYYGLAKLPTVSASP